MSLDVIWLILAVLITGLELIAHFVLHNRRFHTISWLTRWAEHQTGVLGHVVLGVVWILLGVHLEGWLW